MTPAVVAAHDLEVRYAHRRARSTATTALAGIRLRCAPGEVMGVLGPNGAGKSTLLRALATVLRPTSGQLRLFGEPARPSAALRRRLGYAADVAVHVEALTGRENARFFARASGLSATAADAAVDPLLARFDLADDADRPVHEFSFGMRRKLAIAEVLAHSPALVLLDEPTVGLDPRALETLQSLLRERAEGAEGAGCVEGSPPAADRASSTASGAGAPASVVLATNDVRAAQTLCDRVVFLHRGRIVLEGAPDALVRRSDSRTRIEIRLRAGQRALPAAAAGATAAPFTAIQDSTGSIEVVDQAPDRLTLHCAEGAAALPAVCAALVDAGADLRSIHVREPDLRDVFFEATGERLGDAR